jgi:hypothetical protein
MLNRSLPKVAASEVFTGDELKALDHLVPKYKGKLLGDQLIKLAQLGGYLAHKQDPPPGNLVMWRGMERLSDIVLGIKLRDLVVGN